MADTGSDMIETDIESENGRAEPINVSISFNNGKGGAWDDRELINAYDAAMDEFHLHHPGPGSWLDKAMAAQKKGQPLPEAQDTNTAWYTASLPAETQASQSVVEPPNKKRKTNANTAQTKDNPEAGPLITNPYAPIAASNRQNNPSRKSPAYIPPSPPPQREIEEEEDEEAEDEGYDQSEEWYDQSYALSAPPGEPHHATQSQQESGGMGHGTFGPPAFGTQSTAEVSIMEAVGHAMTAQYWAGYWMGVAQAKSTSQASTPGRQLVRSQNEGQTSVSAPQAEVEDDGGVRSNGQILGNTPSNVFVTKQRFSRPGPTFNR